MASYRDRRQPDLLRFPGNLRPRVLILVGLFVNLLCALLTIVTASPWYVRAFDAIVILGLSWFEIRAWPGEITVDSQGLRMHDIFGRCRRFLPWSDIQAVEHARSITHPAVDSLRLSTDILVIRGLSTDQTIVHTSGHPDRDRLLREFELRNVDLPQP